MASKARLSKGILEMKFMKRTKEKVQKENDDEEGRSMYSTEITDRMINTSSNFIIEPSFSHCVELIDGRLSFRGMNPEIERLLELEEAEKEEQKPKDVKKEVTDEDMAEYYGNVVQTMAKKFQNFKKRRFEDDKPGSSKKFMKNQGDKPGFSKKKKFMKPKD